MELLRLLRPERPWLHLLVATESDACDLRAALASAAPVRAVWRVVRGHKARTTAALFDEFAAALQFPCYFGENWDAFEECLTDLTWLPADAYVLLIVQSVHLLDKEPEEQLQRLIEMLKKAGEEWSKPVARPSPRPPRAFHVLLQSSKEDEAAMRAKLGAVKVSFDLMQP